MVGMVYAPLDEFEPIKVDRITTPERNLLFVLSKKFLSLRGIGVCIAAHVFTSAVVYFLMTGKLLTDMVVTAVFVGHQGGLAAGLHSRRRRDRAETCQVRASGGDGRLLTASGPSFRTSAAEGCATVRNPARQRERSELDKVLSVR